jgi:hypothetical protein
MLPSRGVLFLWLRSTRPRHALFPPDLWAELPSADMHIDRQILYRPFFDASSLMVCSQRLSDPVFSVTDPVLFLFSHAFIL